MSGKKKGPIKIAPLEFIKSWNYDYKTLKEINKDNPECDLVIKLEQLIITKWLRYKKIYKINNIFADALIHTKLNSIPAELLRHLPVSCFYIDISGNTKIPMVEGMIIRADFINDIFKISIHIFENGIYDKSMVCMVTYDIENEKIIINDADIFLNLDITNLSVKEIIQKNKRLFSDIAIQFLLYFASKKPDIIRVSHSEEDYEEYDTDYHYRWTNAERWDVGYRYASAVTLSKDRPIRALEFHNRTSKEGKNKRKSPRPHVRCGHWRACRTGKGRTQIKLIWIPPKIICGEQPIITTIHETDADDFKE